MRRDLCQRLLPSDARGGAQCGSVGAGGRQAAIFDATRAVVLWVHIGMLARCEAVVATIGARAIPALVQLATASDQVQAAAIPWREVIALGLAGADDVGFPAGLGMGDLSDDAGRRRLRLVSPGAYPYVARMPWDGSGCHETKKFWCQVLRANRARLETVYGTGG